MELRFPCEELLPSYKAALQRGWSPSSTRPQVADEELAQILDDAAKFLEAQYDPEAKGPPVLQPDGSYKPRIPGYRKWMCVDAAGSGEVVGCISLRWTAEGDASLEPHVLGHIGYGVVPWHRRRGYATKALQLLLPEAKQKRLRHVEVTSEETNVASRKVIEAAGGELYEHFPIPGADGFVPGVRYRIDLSAYS